MRALLAAAVAASAIVAGPAVAATVAPSSDDGPVYILGMHGGPRQGYAISYSDGSAVRMPSRADALEDCASFTTRVERVACRATIRTKYRWMRLTRDSIHAIAP